jgi:ATP/maltotriose-dependent transcriptional regulator MalT
MFKFIEAKLRPPDLRPGLISREHLVSRLGSNLALSATFVCAGPGWGKTTLAAKFLPRALRASVWYHLDSSDADIAVFLQYLVHAVRQVAPDFGRATLDLLRSGAGTRPDQLADLFLYEMSECVTDDLIVVLDNIHHVFKEEWSAPLLYRLLELLPANVHLILLARTAPAFTFSRLRSKQLLDQLDDRALALTREETAELFDGVLDSEAADLLLGWTEGWVGGLQIIRQALEADQQLRKQEIEKIISQTETEIFNYFAEKVYRSKPADVRALLARSALPQRITPDLLSRALGFDVAGSELQAIVRENIFLSRVAGALDTFMFHPLFRDFLRKQLEQETTPHERARLHHSIARYYAEREQWERALHHYFEAGDEAAAADAMIAAERQIIAGGLTLTVSKYFPRFGSETLDSRPQLYNLMGDMHVIEGDNHSARSMFQSALTASRRAADTLSEAAALAGLAHVAARNHDFKDAILHAEQAHGLAPTVASTLGARIKNVIGAALAFEGRYTEANDLMEEALRLAHEAGDARLVRTISHNLALPAYMEGDFRRALRYFARSPISYSENSQLHPDSIALYINRAAVYTARGELDLASRDLVSAEDVAAVFNLRGYMPAILEAHGNIARERRQFQEAECLYNSALNEYRLVDADPVKTDLYYERALLELRRGEISQALELINLMIADRQEAGHEIEEALARQMRGRILIERDAARALSDADASEPLLRRLQCNYYLAIGCHLRARALVGRDRESGLAALSEFFMLAERFDYSNFIAVEESYSPALGELCQVYDVVSGFWFQVSGKAS